MDDRAPKAASTETPEHTWKHPLRAVEGRIANTRVTEFLRFSVVGASGIVINLGFYVLGKPKIPAQPLR